MREVEMMRSLLEALKAAAMFVLWVVTLPLQAIAFIVVILWCAITGRNFND